MAVRGLGCPVRFTLTAGQKGDAPQAAAVIEGLPAEVVMADTAYDADHLRQAIAAKGALAVNRGVFFAKDGLIPERKEVIIRPYYGRRTWYSSSASVAARNDDVLAELRSMRENAPKLSK